MPVGSIISEITLAVVASIAAAALAGVYLTSLGQASDLQRIQVMQLREEMSYGCKVIYAHGREWDTEVKAWVKNTGLKDIPEVLVERSEVILASRDRIHYLLHGSTPPSWTYTLRNDADQDGRWDPGETLEITLKLGEPLPRDDYILKLSLFNGAGCSTRLST